ncbi:amidase [Sphingomonas sp. GlSt437]|uniref:amidase n=1 Tax=Sphingomonas sp. GlSt437 TaxID=3389970 RepID=UPI003A8A76AD
MLDLPALMLANAPLHAFVDWDRTAAFGQGPLGDLTVGVKANIAVRGLPWTGGMGLRREIIAERDAAVVAGLRAAGAAILGTLNMHEAALGATTDNHFYGRTHNPHCIGHTPGGSSGGSGAAVAAGLCDLALGTDTLGSIRIPAAYCGIYGLKPTHGAVSTDGLVFLGRRFDSIGPLARSLDVITRAWAVIAPGHDAGEAPFAGVVTLAGLAGVEVQPAVTAAYDRALAAIGLPTTPLALPAAPTKIRLVALAEIGRELAADIGEARVSRRGDLSPELHFVIGALEAAPLDRQLLDATRAALVEGLGENRVLVMPTAPQAAFAHTPRPPATQADFTTLANVAGLPALAVPAGTDAEGLPVGIQLVGPAGSETRLIALARALEPALGGAVPLPRI